jgi:electron transport complex protein RnfB
MTRREFLIWSGRILALGGLGLAGLRGFASGLFKPNLSTVWQIDPDLCTACGLCRTACVLLPSAVKCVQAYSVCGYCDLCGGYFHSKARNLTTGAENQICPTGAIKRTFVEDPFYEYRIDEDLCVGCGKCVLGCAQFGNASLFLQIKHDRCTGCNECAVERVCPSHAIVRVPRDKPYLLRKGGAGV